MINDNDNNIFGWINIDTKHTKTYTKHIWNVEMKTIENNKKLFCFFLQQPVLDWSMGYLCCICPYETDEKEVLWQHMRTSTDHLEQLISLLKQSQISSQPLPQPQTVHIQFDEFWMFIPMWNTLAAILVNFDKKSEIFFLNQTFSIGKIFFKSLRRDACTF